MPYTYFLKRAIMLLGEIKEWKRKKMQFLKILNGAEWDALDSKSSPYLDTSLPEKHMLKHGSETFMKLYRCVASCRVFVERSCTRQLLLKNLFPYSPTAHSDQDTVQIAYSLFIEV